jgi:hypothetical protein
MVIFEKKIESSFQAVDDVVKEVLKKIKVKFQFMSPRFLFNIDFMLREILNNAVEHGNHFDPNKKVICKIDYRVPVMSFFIKDEGPGINPEDLLLSTHDPKSLLRERNRGHQTIIDMDFDIKLNGNEVNIFLNLNQEVPIWKNNN